MKKFILMCFVLCFSILVFSESISIMFAGDTHGRLIEEIDIETNIKRGGAGYFFGLIDVLRRKYPESLLFDTGDTMHGAYVNDKFKGEPQMLIMGMEDYNGFVPGNHDVGYGINNRIELTDKYNVNTICLNMINENDKSPVFKEYDIIDYKGIKILVTGLLTPLTNLSVTAENLKGIKILELEDVQQRYSQIILDERPDITIMLSHNGFREDELVASLFSPDIILGGHSHTVKSRVTYYGKTRVYHAGSYYRNLGHLKIDFDKKIKKVDYNLYAVTSEYLSKKQNVQEIVDLYNEEVEKELNEIIGYSEKDIKKSDEDISELFIYLCTLLEKSTESDFAQLNNSGIRDYIRKGPVSVRDIFNIFPFGNMGVVLNVKGKDLLDDPWILKYKDIDADKIYKVVTNSYLAEKNDTFNLKGFDKNTLEFTIRELVVNAMKNQL
ncbi:MAG: 5'-nucleotidase C-terminal domain-containing protein [Candidatus Muirbacterium halophilum]|nr:5'-nucleotidase C-terminal domain-containing protein [Candidatus Muirbacterium halophilum]